MKIERGEKNEVGKFRNETRPSISKKQEYLRTLYGGARSFRHQSRGTSWKLAAWQGNRDNGVSKTGSTRRRMSVARSCSREYSSYF